MFCSVCGKQLPDNARFCDGCGTQLAAPTQQAPVQQVPQYQQPQYQQPQYQQTQYQQPMYQQPMYQQPYQPKAPSPVFAKFGAAFKNFFSKNTIKGLGESAKSNTLEWLLLFAVSAIAYILALPLNVLGLFGSVTRYFGGGVNFGIWILYAIVLAAASYFLMSVLVFLTVKVIYRKNVTITNVFNLVATASLPLACAWVLNAIFGFVWFPLTFVFTIVGIVAFAILLYIGIQKLADFESAPFWAYILIWGIFVLVIGLLAYLIFKISLNAMGSIMSFMGMY